MSDAVVAAGPSAGVLLRQAREAAGLHVAALATSLKVPVRKLEALEEDRYEQLTDAVFARALASSVCRTLKIDPQPVLDRLPKTAVPRLVQDHEGLDEPFRAPGDVAGTAGWRELLLRPTTLAVAGLLVGAIVILLLPNMRREAPAAAVKTDAPEVVMATPVMLPSATPAEAAAAAPAGVAGPTTGSSMPLAPAAPTAAPATATAAPAPTAIPAAHTSPTAPAPAAAPIKSWPPANGVVVFKATGQAWVEVTDVDGNFVLRRLLEAGESAGASGTLPLSVTVGSVSTTSVEVRGKPFDMGRVSRDNVARFQIN